MMKMTLGKNNTGSGTVVTAFIYGTLITVISIFIISVIASALLSIAPNEDAAEIIQTTKNASYFALGLLSAAGTATFLFYLFKNLSG